MLKPQFSAVKELSKYVAKEKAMLWKEMTGTIKESDLNFMRVKKTCCISVSVDAQNSLTHFWSMLPLYNPSKHQKTKGFLVFPGSVK